MAGYGEKEVVDKLNKKFSRELIHANAYRNPQARGQLQNCDVCVDSMIREWFIAIEVKSIRKDEYFNFLKYFTIDKRGEHQLDRLCEFARAGDREAIIVLFVRNSTRNRSIYTFDALTLNVLRMEGKKSLKPNEFKKYDTGWFQEHLGGKRGC